MSVSREEVIAMLSKMSGNRRARKKLEVIDDETLLFTSGVKLNSFVVVDFLRVLGKKLDKKFTADDVTLEDLDSVGQIMVFIDKHSK